MSAVAELNLSHAMPKTFQHGVTHLLAIRFNNKPHPAVSGILYCHDGIGMHDCLKDFHCEQCQLVCTAHLFLFELGEIWPSQRVAVIAQLSRRWRALSAQQSGDGPLSGSTSGAAGQRNVD